MTITLETTPELQAELARQAAAHGSSGAAHGRSLERENYRPSYSCSPSSKLKVLEANSEVVGPTHDWRAAARPRACHCFEIGSYAGRAEGVIADFGLDAGVSRAALDLLPGAFHQRFFARRFLRGCLALRARVSLRATSCFSAAVALSQRARAA
jgi:hypothetical protein